MEKTKPVTKTALAICAVCSKNHALQEGNCGCPFRCLGNDYCNDILELDSHLYEFFKKQFLSSENI